MTGAMQDLLPFATALAVGLLIGTERERRKGATRERNAAGIRTFALTAVLGAVAMRAGGVWIVASVVLAVGGLLSIAYMRSHDDPGITTETSLILTLLLGVLAHRSPGLTIAIGVAVAGVIR